MKSLKELFNRNPVEQTRRYPEEHPQTPDDDDGTMPDNVASLAQHVVGHRIVEAAIGSAIVNLHGYDSELSGLVLTLDNGKQVVLSDTYDCCAYTELDAFFLDPSSVDHVILGVETEGGYTKWHIYADHGDILQLQVGWSCGNPFYYGYGFSINVTDVAGTETP